MTRIVTYAHRYKRPPPKRAKAAALEGPVIARAKKPRAGSATEPVEPQTTPPPTNDDRKSAIVTARRPGKRHAEVPEVTEEEHRRVGDLADAMFHEMKRAIAEKVRR